MSQQDIYRIVVSVFLKSKNTGYAMWNMIGSMGIINSERSDCNYEQYRGKLLDREMATIIQGMANRNSQNFFSSVTIFHPSTTSFNSSVLFTIFT